MSLLRYVIFLFLYVSNYYWYRHRLEVYNSWSTSIVRKDVLVLDKPFHKIAPLKKNSQGRFCETICCKLSFFFWRKNISSTWSVESPPWCFLQVDNVVSFPGKVKSSVDGAIETGAVLQLLRGWRLAAPSRVSSCEARMWWVQWQEQGNLSFFLNVFEHSQPGKYIRFTSHSLRLYHSSWVACQHLPQDLFVEKPPVDFTLAKQIRFWMI